MHLCSTYFYLHVAQVRPSQESVRSVKAGKRTTLSTLFKSWMVIITMAGNRDRLPTTAGLRRKRTPPFAQQRPSSSAATYTNFLPWLFVLKASAPGDIPYVSPDAGRTRYFIHAMGAPPLQLFQPGYTRSGQPMVFH